MYLFFSFWHKNTANDTAGLKWAPDIPAAKIYIRMYALAPNDIYSSEDDVQTKVAVSSIVPTNSKQRAAMYAFDFASNKAIPVSISWNLFLLIIKDLI